MSERREFWGTIRKGTSLRRVSKAKKPIPPLFLRDFDPQAGSAQMPSVLVLGYALLGSRECASLLYSEALAEDKAADAENRPSRYSDYIRAWHAEASRRLEGIARPKSVDMRRALGLVRAGQAGNAPQRLRPLCTFSRVVRAHAANPRQGTGQAKLAIADELEQAQSARKQARDKTKTVEEHMTYARQAVRVVDVLAKAVSPEEITRDAVASAVANECVVALRCGIEALERLPSLSAESRDLVRRVRSVS